MIVVYQLLWLWDLANVRAFLATQPYNMYRMGNQIVRMQVGGLNGALCGLIDSTHTQSAFTAPPTPHLSRSGCAGWPSLSSWPD